MDQLFNETKERMHKILEVIKGDLGTVRTGKATPSLVENIVVSAYAGSAKMKVMELATISVSDPQTIVVAPYDHTIMGEIQKGIIDANIGLNPTNDGQVIRISLPPLSQERREQLIHLMKQKLEHGRIMVRQARQDAMHEVKKQELSEDEEKRHEKEVQKLTDDTMEQIDEIGKAKEHELLQI